MITAEDTRREKAKKLRYKKPIVKDINLWQIREDLDEMAEACDEVRYYWETDDNTLLNALDGDEDEAHEFKMAFADLCAECEQMRSDMEDSWIPECFDGLFVAVGAGGYGGGYLGYDEYEQDYFGLNLSASFVESEGIKKMERLTKKELLEAVGACLRVLYSYIGLRCRYDSIKAAFDILRDKNTGILKISKEINGLYEKCEEELFSEQSPSGRRFKEMCAALPQEAWLW